MIFQGLNPLFASHSNCHLLSHQIGYIVNNMDPDQTAPMGAV